MRPMPALLATGLVLAWMQPAAAQPAPEIQRQPAAAQAAGVVHTLRAIPEACVRFEGSFTGQAAEPYRWAAVPTSPQCQPRARLVDYAEARPAEADGWKFNDLIRVPSADCPAQVAVLRVWRKPGEVATPALDGQGRSRIYLEEARRQAQSGAQPAGLPLYAADLQVEGAACR